MEFIKRNPKIFILSGKARSGKTESAKIIENYYKEKKCITISFAYYLKDYIKRITGWDGSENTKPRELLQKLGIELIKNKYKGFGIIDTLREMDVNGFNMGTSGSILSNINKKIDIKLSKLNEYPGYKINRLPKLKPIIPNIV